MAKVLVDGIVHEAGRALLAARPDVEFEVLDPISVADLEARIAALDAVIVRLTQVQAETIAKAKRLKVVSRFGVGYDAIDVAALTRHGIPLTIVGDVNAVTVAEHTLGMMLAVARRLVLYDRQVHARDYTRRAAADHAELWRKTVLIVGFGRVGRRVARLCAAFDMEVIAADPLVPRRDVEEAGYGYVADFREALPAADFVTLHLPANPDGTPVMASAEFKAMKPGAIFVNAARGSLVDEQALAEACSAGRLGGAGLDVLRHEPPAPDCPLLGLDNVIMTPHSAAYTGECNRRSSLVSAQNVLDALDDRLNPELVVNREVLG